MSKPKPEVQHCIGNKKAHYDYVISDKIECGIVLVGTEVKSLRLGLGKLLEAFAEIKDGKLFLVNCYIDPYPHASPLANHDPVRRRVLLASKKEIAKLDDAIDGTGMTLMPLSVYWKNGRAKVEIGVAQGKKSFDKRSTIKEREAKRDLRRLMTRR